MQRRIPVKMAMKQPERSATPLTAQALLENLEDAGCGPEVTERFLALERSGQYREQLRLLSGHRRKLLDRLHREERRIGCLDYLVYQLEKPPRRRILNPIDIGGVAMTIIQNQAFDQERALYGMKELLVRDCSFDGPADGESAFKECSGIQVEHSFFNLRYPFWHDHGLSIKDCELTDKCRAALWYSEHITIENTKLHGIKALRECADAVVKNCDILSPEFGWNSRQVTMEDCTAQSEYFMMRGTDLHFRNASFKGKYSFQYIENSVFENCSFDTKDAFWHAKNVVVRDCVVKGEYLAWYCENVTFERCKIIGTQPLCYCKGLKLIDCEMVDCDLAFERSEVQATVTTPVVSVKNPLVGSHITVPAMGEIIRDIPEAGGEVIVRAGDRAVCA